MRGSREARLPFLTVLAYFGIVCLDFGIVFDQTRLFFGFPGTIFWSSQGIGDGFILAFPPRVVGPSRHE